jgi:transcriptional regulator
LVSAFDTMSRRHQRLDLLQGTLDLLILRALQKEPQHGWAIAERIEQLSEHVLEVNQGSLYPALHRLEHEGWIEAEWGVSELGRRARFYRLTSAGRKQLDAESEQWDRMTAAITRVLRMA